jgi:GAF domain
MRWLKDRFRGAINSGIQGLIWVGVVAVLVFAWSRRGTDVTLPVWALALSIAVPVGALLTLLVRRATKRGHAGLVADLQQELDLGAYYSRHIYDILDTLQKVLQGTIPDVTVGAFIEEGILEPARDFLVQQPGEDVRLSVLVPDNGHWSMAFAAGYRLESRQRFSLPIIGSFSRHAYETGEIQWSFDLQNDPRFTPHPQATRIYHSIISLPIRSGEQTVAVFNADSTFRWAFSLADFIYLTLLAAIVGVAWTLGGLDPAVDVAAGQEDDLPGNENDDRGVH